ncbi:MAG: HAMP domain-containing sensor histidine kinase [Acidobacteria bacterium]|nr:HAMP domain-containing sensor histidine kinase [Acidobacteriota bacterium]
MQRLCYKSALMHLRQPSSARDATARRRPLLVLGALVVAPAVLLAALGLRTLAQDTRLAEAQARERLDRAAGRAALDLDHALADWQGAVDRIDARDPLVVARLPRLIAGVLESSPDAVAMVVGPHRQDAVPSGRVLYLLDAVSQDTSQIGAVPAALRAGERWELQAGDFGRAADAYRALLAAPDRTLRPWALQRLARTLAKAGNREEAGRYYEALGRETGAMIGSVPAGLIAGFERCALEERLGSSKDLARVAADFHAALSSGRWPRLEKSRYLYYSIQARAWLAKASATQAVGVAERLDAEQQRLALTDVAASAFAAIWAAGQHAAGHLVLPVSAGHAMVFWRTTPAGNGQTAMVLLGDNALRTRVWPAVLSAASSADVSLSLVAPDGTTIVSEPGITHAADGATASRVQTMQDGEFLWRVRADPRRPDAINAEVAQRRWLYVSMLVVMVGGLLTSGFLVVRTLKREVEVARLKSQFVAAVSHEFRSPLTGISQLSELLVGGQVRDEERRQQYYELIHSESRRLSRLVEHVLDFARMEDGQKEYRREPIDISPWLRAVADEFQRSLPAKGKTVATSVPDNLPPIVADAQALSGAIQNLLDNAVKYSPECDTVWLDASTTASTVVITVRDRGVGIPPGEQPHVFERFYRGHAASAVTGTGLGLSLVKHVVEAHGGTITLDSKVGEGTTVTITLRP